MQKCIGKNVFNLSVFKTSCVRVKKRWTKRTKGTAEEEVAAAAVAVAAAAAAAARHLPALYNLMNMKYVDI